MKMRNKKKIKINNANDKLRKRNWKKAGDRPLFLPAVG
jgi:hypothetical protein